MHTTATFQPVWKSIATEEVCALPIARHPAFDRAMAGMPEHVRCTFSAEQLECLSSVLTPKPARHWIDWRVSIPFLGRRYYVTLLFGKERRDLARLHQEGQLSLSRIYVVYLILALAGLVLLSALILFALYLAKSTLGMDVFEGPSEFHEILDMMRETRGASLTGFGLSWLGVT